MIHQLKGAREHAIGCVGVCKQNASFILSIILISASQETINCIGAIFCGLQNGYLRLEGYNSQKTIAVKEIKFSLLDELH